MSCNSAQINDIEDSIPIIIKNLVLFIITIGNSKKIRVSKWVTSPSKWAGCAPWFPWPIGGVRWWWFAGLAAKRYLIFNFFGRPCAEKRAQGQSHQYGNYKNINQLLFHRPSSVIFQWVYGPQLQRMSRSALEITAVL